jgi:CxxC motif-containing protein (DUF1111 family)
MTVPKWTLRWFCSFLSSALFALALIALAGRDSSRMYALTPTGPPVGTPLPGLTGFELNLYNIGTLPFDVNWPPSLGLGPVFTAAGCRGCHSGSGGGGFSTFKITLFGTLNPDGSFNPLANEGGPLLQPQTDAPLIANGTCVLRGETLPGDANIISKRQVPALFGSGLIDAIPDATIEANASFEASDPTSQVLGIHGVPNMTADLNGVLRPGRFGFKAQLPTLLQQVAGAFQHDVGFTSPINPNEDLPQGNPIPPNCQAAATEPNDIGGHITLEIFQVLEFVAPLAPAPPTATTQAGQAVFSSIGCANCHIPSLQTGANFAVPLTLTSSGTVASSETSAALSSQNANLYSDLLLHDMGSGLADAVAQGQASGSQWRTTPLWGLSRRTSFLHDGRTQNLNTAILNHGGEAAAAVSNYSALSATDQANLQAFLNSL